MDRTRETHDALRRARELKEWAVHSHGVGVDIPNLVALIYEGVERMIIDLSDETPWSVAEKIRGIVALTDADVVQFIGEAYRYETDEQHPERPAVGELARRFSEGDHSVKEVLWVVTWDERSPEDCLAVELPYAYDGRELVWGEEVELRGLEGGLHACVPQGFQLRRLRDHPPLTARELAQRHGIRVIEPRFRTPRRNEPCPCGSGRKAKYCCWGTS